MGYRTRRRHSNPPWWKTSHGYTAIVTAIATVLAALIAGVFGLLDQGQDQDDHAGEYPGTSVGSTTTTIRPPAKLTKRQYVILANKICFSARPKAVELYTELNRSGISRRWEMGALREYQRLKINVRDQLAMLPSPHGDEDSIRDLRKRYDRALGLWEAFSYDLWGDNFGSPRAQNEALKAYNDAKYEYRREATSYGIRECADLYLF